MKTTWFVGCYWLQVKERWTNSGLKNKMFVDLSSQKSECRGSKVD